MTKQFFIGFIGQEHFWQVGADNAKQAKNKFAEYHQIKLSSYIKQYRKQPSGLIAGYIN